MSNIFKTRDLELVTERVRRMLKSGDLKDLCTNGTFIRDVTTLVDALENVEEIIFKEEGDE